MKAKTQLQTQHHPRAILGQIHEYISGNGFFFTKQEIGNFFLSLKTKPFVILAGISGTGKTQLPRQFAAAIGAKANCCLIPVRPDWTDNTDLIGYTDLRGNFRTQALTRQVIKAHQHPDEIFFVILDEMNLARVEYYLSDFLSIMETREKVGDTVITDPLISTELLGEHPDPDLMNLTIPDNLYLIGTVNMDETTHPFSRKVLDRANSIEMNQVHLDWTISQEPVEPLSGVYNDFLRANFVQPKDVSEAEKEKVKNTLALLMKINEILKMADLQFGYRTRDEFAFYMLNRMEIRELVSENEATDFQIMQKILPRIHGSSRRVGEVILDLLKLFTEGKMNWEDEVYASEIIERIGNPRKRNFVYPRSIEKLMLMYRRFEEDGFTSFWI
ncbi:MAG: AAA family ATPase [Bacteroidetes bacterium]|nr:AAA family ATPase [Bacteroidota bacterium]